MAVVENATECDGEELVTKRTDVAIEGEPLKVNVRRAEDGCARGLVASARFDADETVLDDVDPSDAMLARERVQLEEDLDRIGVCLVGRGDLDGETGPELDGDAIGLGWGVFDGLGELPHVFWRGRVGIFEDASFVGNVEEVFICGPGLGSCLLNGDLFFAGVCEEGLTTGETVVEF